MADLPDAPLSREEDYLASIAGQNVEVPPCPRSRKEAYLDAIDTKMDNIEEDIENLKNNPDVVDVVNTYADLQAYDKTKLTDNDIIRVLNDETHDGGSTYYRYSTATQTFTYIGMTKQYTNFVGTDGVTAGEAGLVPAPATTDVGKVLKADGTWAIPEGGIKTLTSADYNWHYSGSADDGVSLWDKAPGIYIAEAGVKVYYGSYYDAFNVSDCRRVISVSQTNSDQAMITMLGRPMYNRLVSFASKTANGNIASELVSGATYLKGDDNINNLTSTNTFRPLSANQGKVLNDRLVIVEGQLVGLESALQTINNGGND